MSPIVPLFGQGTQYVNMCQTTPKLEKFIDTESIDRSRVKRCINYAGKFVGFRIKEMFRSRCTVCRFKGSVYRLSALMMFRTRMTQILYWLYCVPKRNVRSLCHLIALSFRRNTMFRHDYLALLARSQQWSTPLCKRSKKGGLRSPNLIYFHVAGHILPPDLELHWLFLAYDIMSMCKLLLLSICPRNFLHGRPETHGMRRGSHTSSTVTTNKFAPIGGGRSHVFSSDDIFPFVLDGGGDISPASVFGFVDHVDDTGLLPYPVKQDFVHVNIPLPYLIPHLPVRLIHKIARIHHIPFGSHEPKKDLLLHFENHNCVSCHSYVSVFSVMMGPLFKDRIRKQLHVPKPHAKNQMTEDTGAGHVYPFPPPPLSPDLSRSIITDFCNDSLPSRFEEAGCAVCGELIPIHNLSRLKSVKGMLKILEVPGVTRVERNKSTEAIREYKGPVLDYRCDKICGECRRCIRKGRVPRLALARGLWIGNVPKVLSDLRFVEKLLIARIRHNCCFVRVASGMRKMTSHVIAFQSPIPKVYHTLPPPIEEMDDVLAVLFTGPCKPTEVDFKRTPLLVRRNHVAKALEWLKLNHCDYADLEISYDNLSGYPEDSPPVSVEYRHSTSNKVPEGTSVFDNECEDGTEKGDCPFIVHGLTGEQLDTKSINSLKGIALRHLNSGGKMLAVGHSSKYESIYNNPALYPQIFPWLFPYGLGGIGTTTLSDAEHKRHLLMFHDKRFQVDVNFPFVAFSHAQVKACTTGGFLLAETDKFYDISNRLLNVDQQVLSLLAKRLSDGESVTPKNQEEKDCFQVIRDLDHIGGKVDGSTTSKKFMRNEIWSLMSYCGAPSWYITLSPADVKHPICLYFADTKECFRPTIRANDERIRLIASNPVAGARFFHFMVSLFIKHVLGVGSDHPGAYGETSAYYGTVEQQGRLTLHLHLLLWIRGNLTPQEIRDRILDTNSDFQQKIIEYLESTHVGDFLSGSQEEVLSRVDIASQSDGYLDPTQTLPDGPPKPCCNQCENLSCRKCSNLKSWWVKFKSTVDDIMSKSNIHRCSTNKNKDGTQNKKRQYVGCRDNKWGNCKARFPRPVFKQTEVDQETGALNMKKREPMINTVTPLVTYLFRCNTDVTSLKSGTAIKGVILYVSDYITKVSLKTHVIFDTIRAMFQKNSEMVGGTESRKDKARRLMTKIVNNLSAKMEMGAPMVSMYLLRNPDHYTNYKFAPFYWQAYVKEARKVWHPKDSSDHPDKVTLIKRRGQIIGLSLVLDYTYRPLELSHMSLYDWIRRCKREKLPKPKVNASKTGVTIRGDILEPDCDGFKPDCNDFESDCDNFESDCDNFESDGDDLEPDCSDLEPDCNAFNQNDYDCSLNGSDIGIFKFVKDHPFYKTHGTRCVPEVKALVPNFLGATLPRCDGCDREYYCSTMLTLFKPWRSGYDLKTENQTWDESFLSYEFTERQKTLIANFNIRYECLDARDDFHAQLRSGSAILPSWATDHNFAENAEDELEVDDVGDIELDMQEDLDIHLNEIGRREKQRRLEMAAMRDVMTQSGWTEPLSEMPLASPLLPVSLPEVIQSGSQWKADVQKKRQDLLDLRAQHLPASSTDGAHQNKLTVSPNTNQVKIVDKSYLERTYCSPKCQSVIDGIVNNFHLNQEQERAFRIVVNHASSVNCEQLKMYIGGMGGTGKTQVLKAIVQFFKNRNESHRFVIVAPTGSAAALLAGSTYHYMFGLNEQNDEQISNVQLSQLKSRLEGVDYVFLDEVSMLSCRDMYRISVRLARIFNETESPFGGLNMIFAGDFGQLPPAIGHEHASLYSRTVGGRPNSLHDQEAAIGKALWHQVTTVVILRQNMRQIDQTKDDAALRQALTNLRYKACTPADLVFLRSRISSDAPGRLSVKQNQFRGVSIITALNLHKDEINRLGSLRFAKETGQTLTDFFSEDRISSGEPKKVKQSKRRAVKKAATISDNVQSLLWNQPHSTNSRNIPGKLSLCIGMPVMIRNNSATELCITKGQEGIIHSWQSTIGSRGQRILDTLFVTLVNPPQSVKIDKLPENVVPLTRTSVNISCYLPDDSTVSLSREQVEVLPNFSMTDFASQGKSRPYNPVNLTNSRSHQSYYTALSRSTSAAGTVILQGFDAKKMTGGASGALRQEFRELELLDDIVQLKYEGKLAMSVVGDRRNTLIHSFRKWKGDHYVPVNVHKAIRWSKSDPLVVESDVKVSWHILDKIQKAGHVGAPKSAATFSNETSPVEFTLVNSKRKVNHSHLATEHDTKRPKSDRTSPVEFTLVGSKRKASHSDIVTEHGAKRLKPHHSNDILPNLRISVPTGTRWRNNSCAYDAVVSILYAIWLDDDISRSEAFKELNAKFLGAMAEDFQEHVAGKYTLEDVRDFLRRRLYHAAPHLFPWNRDTSVHSMMDYLLQTPSPVISSQLSCPNHHLLRGTQVIGKNSHISIGTHNCTSIQGLINSFQSESASNCSICGNSLDRIYKFVSTPLLLAFDLTVIGSDCVLSQMLNIPVHDQQAQYKLSGIIYHGNNHFTSRIVNSAGMVWFHDGLVTGNSMVYDGLIDSLDLSVCRSKLATLALYVMVT
jgi:hypothetical protein